MGNGYRAYQDWVDALSTPARIRREIFIESPLPHPTAVMRRGVFERLGGYRHVPWAEDYDLWLRAYTAGVSMGKPLGILLHWRDHGAVYRECRNVIHEQTSCALSRTIWLAPSCAPGQQ